MTDLPGNESSKHIAVGLPGPSFSVTNPDNLQPPQGESDDQQERRRYVRVAKTIELELRHEEHPIKASMIDLSEGGIRCHLETEQLLDPAEIVRARVNLGEGELQVKGEISWIVNEDNSTEMGIKFIELTEKEAQKIRARVYAIQLEQRRADRGHSGHRRR